MSAELTTYSTIHKRDTSEQEAAQGFLPIYRIAGWCRSLWRTRRPRSWIGKPENGPMPIRPAGPPDLGGAPFALESLRLTQTRRPRNAHIRRMVIAENRQTLGTSVLSALMNKMINRNTKSESPTKSGRSVRTSSKRGNARCPSICENAARARRPGAPTCSGTVDAGNIAQSSRASRWCHRSEICSR